MRNISNTVGNAIHAACQWAMVSVLARQGPPELIGQYALGIAISGPLLLLARPEARSTKAADIRVLALVLATLGVAAIGFADPATHQRWSILLVAAAQMVEWTAELYRGRRDASSLILHGLASLAALVFGAGLLGVLIVRVLVLVVYDLRQPRYDDGLAMREPALPSIALNIPCYFIAHMAGYRGLGIYAAMACLTPALDVLASALREQPAELKDLARTVLLMSFGAVVSAIVWGPKLITTLFGPDYLTGVGILILLMAATGVSCLATTLEAQPSASWELFVAATVILGCLALIPHFGLLGAAMGLTLGAITRMARPLVTAADRL